MCLAEFVFQVIYGSTLVGRWSRSKYREDQVYGCLLLPKYRTKLQFTNC